jgi:hypothetical protein
MTPVSSCSSSGRSRRKEKTTITHERAGRSAGSAAAVVEDASAPDSRETSASTYNSPSTDTSSEAVSMDDVNKAANASTTAQTQEEIASIVKNSRQVFLRPLITLL